MDDPVTFQPATQDFQFRSQKQMKQIRAYTGPLEDDLPMTIGEAQKVIHGGRSRVLNSPDFHKPF